MWLTPQLYNVILIVAVMFPTFQSFKEDLQSSGCLKPYHEYVRLKKKYVRSPIYKANNLCMNASITIIFTAVRVIHGVKDAIFPVFISNHQHHYYSNLIF